MLPEMGISSHEKATATRLSLIITSTMVIFLLPENCSILQKPTVIPLLYNEKLRYFFAVNGGCQRKLQCERVFCKPPSWKCLRYLAGDGRYSAFAQRYGSIPRIMCPRIPPEQALRRKTRAYIYCRAGTF